MYRLQKNENCLTVTTVHNISLANFFLIG